MNSIVPLLLFGFLLSTKAQEKVPLNQIPDKCTKEFGFTSEQLNKAMKEAFMQQKSPEEKMKCFVACVNAEHSEATPDEIFNLAKNFKTAIGSSLTKSKEELLKEIQDCEKIKGDNDCDTAWKLSVCAMGTMLKA